MWHVLVLHGNLGYLPSSVELMHTQQVVSPVYCLRVQGPGIFRDGRTSDKPGCLEDLLALPDILTRCKGDAQKTWLNYSLQICVREWGFCFGSVSLWHHRKTQQHCPESKSAAGGVPRRQGGWLSC